MAEIRSTPIGYDREGNPPAQVRHVSTPTKPKDGTGDARRYPNDGVTSGAKKSDLGAQTHRKKALNEKGGKIL